MKRLRNILIIALPLMLTACSGGSDNDDAPPVVELPPETRSLVNIMDLPISVNHILTDGE